MFKDGNEAFKEVVRRSGPELARHQRVGRGMAASHASCGKSLFVSKRKRGANVRSSSSSSRVAANRGGAAGELALDLAALGCASRSNLREFEAFSASVIKERRGQAAANARKVSRGR